MHALDNTILLGSLTVRFLVEPQDSDGALSVFECALAEGGLMLPVPHHHDAFEETVVGLEGTTVWTVDGEDHEVGPGDSVFIRRGAVHGFATPGGAAARFLAIATPGLMTPGYFLDMREVAAAAQAAGTRPDPAAMAAVMLRHGLTPAPRG